MTTWKNQCLFKIWNSAVSIFIDSITLRVFYKNVSHVWWLNQPVWKTYDHQIGSSPKGPRQKLYKPFWNHHLIFFGIEEWIIFIFFCLNRSAHVTISTPPFHPQKKACKKATARARAAYKINVKRGHITSGGKFFQHFHDVFAAFITGKRTCFYLNGGEKSVTLIFFWEI